MARVRFPPSVPFVPPNDAEILSTKLVPRSYPVETRFPRFFSFLSEKPSSCFSSRTESPHLRRVKGAKVSYRVVYRVPQREESKERRGRLGNKEEEDSERSSAVSEVRAKRTCCLSPAFSVSVRPSVGNKYPVFVEQLSSNEGCA